MNNPAASSGVSLGVVILFAASGGEFDPERLITVNITLQSNALFSWFANIPEIGNDYKETNNYTDDS